MIYRLILVDVDYEGQHRPWFPAFRQPTVTQVNRQIRKDTLPMFYANNMFKLRVPSPHHSFDLDHAKEEQRWMRFVRGLKLVAACGYLPIVRHLTITYTDRGLERDQNLGPFSIDTGMNIIIECFRAEYKTPNFEELARKMGISKERFKANWDLMMGIRVGNDDTDWKDCDAVDEALQIAIDQFTAKLEDRGYLRAADTVRRMTVGRLVEALHALLQGQGSVMRYMVFSAADRRIYVD